MKHTQTCNGPKVVPHDMPRIHLANFVHIGDLLRLSGCDTSKVKDVTKWDPVPVRGANPGFLCVSVLIHVPFDIVND